MDQVVGNEFRWDVFEDDALIDEVFAKDDSDAVLLAMAKISAGGRNPGKLSVARKRWGTYGVEDIDHLTARLVALRDAVRETLAVVPHNDPWKMRFEKLRKVLETTEQPRRRGGVGLKL